jgi:hypothetical protein
MTNKVTGCAASHDDNANLSVARESVQRLGERDAHLVIHVDAPCAAQCNDRNSISYSCRQNIGVHRVLLRPDVGLPPELLKCFRSDNKFRVISSWTSIGQATYLSNISSGSCPSEAR